MFSRQSKIHKNLVLDLYLVKNEYTYIKKAKKFRYVVRPNFLSNILYTFTFWNDNGDGKEMRE